MTAAPQKSRPAAGTAEAARRNEKSTAPTYDQAGRKASDQKPDGFAAFRGRWIEQALQDHELSAGAFRTLAALAHFFLNRRTRTFWPAQETIADTTGDPLRTVQRHLAELQKRGHLGVKRQGRDRPNVYYPIFHDAPEMADHDDGMTRQNLRDDPPNPVAKTRQKWRGNPLKEPIDKYRRARSAPADSDHSDRSRDALLAGASPNPVCSFRLNDHVEITGHGLCRVYNGAFHDGVN